MSAIPFDAFAFTHTLVDAGVPNNQADSIAQAFNKAIQESNAIVIEQTKITIEHFKSEYKLDDVATNKSLDSRANETELKLDARIKETELKIEMLRSDLTRDISKVSKEISDSNAALSRTILNVGVGVGLTQVFAAFVLFMRMMGKV
jgi:hypothetical protein